MIEFKGLREGVRWISPREEMLLVVKRLAEFGARAGVTIRITSLNDHTHSAKSLHYEDLALDCQIVKKDGSVSMGQMDRLARHLRKSLPGGCYDIVWRSPGHERHIHVEYDSRQRGTGNG